MIEGNKCDEQIETKMLNDKRYFLKIINLYVPTWLTFSVGCLQLICSSRRSHEVSMMMNIINVLPKS